MPSSATGGHGAEAPRHLARARGYVVSFDGRTLRIVEQPGHARRRRGHVVLTPELRAAEVTSLSWRPARLLGPGRLTLRGEEGQTIRLWFRSSESAALERLLAALRSAQVDGAAESGPTSRATAEQDDLPG